MILLLVIVYDNVVYVCVRLRYDFLEMVISVTMVDYDEFLYVLIRYLVR